MDEALSALQPAYQVTKEMSAEKYTSLSKVVPLVRLISDKLKLLNTGISKSLQGHFDRYFSYVQDEQVGQFATLLDPRFKDRMFSEETKQTIFEEVKTEMEGLAPFQTHYRRGKKW